MESSPLAVGRVEQRARWRSPTVDAGAAVMVVSALAVAYLTVVPLAVLALMALTEGDPIEPGGLTLAHFAKVLGNPASYNLLANSASYALGATAVAVALGTAVAWAVERTDIPFKGVFVALSLVPLIMPGVLFTVAWLFLLTRRTGLLNILLENVFGIGPVDVHSLPGMMFVEGISNWPLPFLMMAAAFRSMNPALEEAAMTSGASMFATFRRVTLRLALPSFFAVTLITLVRSLESFEVPALIGVRGKVLVFTSQIFLVLRGYPPDFGTAAVFALLLVGISVVGIYFYRRLTATSEVFATITGKGYRASTIALGRWRWPVTGLVGLFYFIAVGLPVFILVWASLLRSYRVPSLEVLSTVTLENYVKAAANDTVIRAAENSAMLAVLTATVTMLLTAIIAWIVVRTRIPGRGVLDGLAFVPIAIPGIVIGLSLMWFYLAAPIPVYGTIWILLIAYVTGRMPYGMRLSSASMLQIHRELEEAAHIAGAGWLRTFRSIVLPLLKPGLLAGWIYIVIIVMREFSASILLYSSESVVLSVLLFDLWIDGRFTEVAAIGVIMSLILALVVGVYHRLGGRLAL